jgi:hypothetical protein
MAKDPDARFPTMDAFAAELEACLAEIGATHVLPGRAVPPPARPAAPRRHRSAAWPIVFALVLLIAAGAVAAYLILRSSHQHAGNGRGNGGTPAPLAGTVPLHAITAYDPFGDGHEHNERVAFATDNDPSTYWETEHYDNPPSLGKAGVGLILDAGTPVQLKQLGLSTATPGFTAEIKASDSTTSFPSVVAGPQVTSSRTYFTIHGGSYRYYLIWITRLAGTDPAAYINEVRAS